MKRNIFFKLWNNFVIIFIKYLINLKEIFLSCSFNILLLVIVQNYLNSKPFIYKNHKTTFRKDRNYNVLVVPNNIRFHWHGEMLETIMVAITFIEMTPLSVTVWQKLLLPILNHKVLLLVFLKNYNVINKLPSIRFQRFFIFTPYLIYKSEGKNSLYFLSVKGTRLV